MALLLLILLLGVEVYAADRITECKPQRVSDNRYWSYRIVDGRTCWYPGHPGKPKTELRWPSLPSKLEPSEAEQPGSTFIPVASGAAPAEPPTLVEEIPWQATPEDQLLALTCCWPELPTAEPLVETTPLVLPKATPSGPVIWPVIFLPVIVVTVAVLLIKRRLT